MEKRGRSFRNWCSSRKCRAKGNQCTWIYLVGGLDSSQTENTISEGRAERIREEGEAKLFEQP